MADPPRRHRTSASRRATASTRPGCESSDGGLVPIGTFNEARERHALGRGLTGDYKALTVTRERADGNQASSGEKVLAGPVRTG